jgi:hypothetical protein
MGGRVDLPSVDADSCMLNCHCVILESAVKLAQQTVNIQLTPDTNICDPQFREAYPARILPSSNIAIVWPSPSVRSVMEPFT